MMKQASSISLVGYDFPARLAPQEQDLTALKEAGRKLAALLEASGVKEEEIIADFQKARQLERMARTSAFNLDIL